MGYSHARGRARERDVSPVARWPDNQPHGAARAFGAGGELEKRLGTDGGDTSDRPQRRANDLGFDRDAENIALPSRAP